MIGTSEENNTEIVTMAFASLRTMIDAQERILKQQIVDIERKNKTSVTDYQRQLEYKEKILSRKNEYIKSSVAAKEHVQLLQVKEQLKISLKDFTKDLDELKTPVKTDYKIQGIEKLETFVSDFLKQVSIAIPEPGMFFTSKSRWCERIDLSVR